MGRGGSVLPGGGHRPSGTNGLTRETVDDGLGFAHLCNNGVNVDRFGTGDPFLVTNEGLEHLVCLHESGMQADDCLDLVRFDPGLGLVTTPQSKQICRHAQTGHGSTLLNQLPLFR